MRILGLLGVFILVSTQTVPTLKDGVYADAQADRGKTTYASTCAFCHGDAGEGSGETPALVGADFLKHWDGQTMQDLFDKVQQTMPATAPGSLTNADVVDLLSFMLRSNKFPAGSSELRADKELLKSIKIKAN
jgi:cytochrome c